MRWPAAAGESVGGGLSSTAHQNVAAAHKAQKSQPFTEATPNLGVAAEITPLSASPGGHKPAARCNTHAKYLKRSGYEVEATQGRWFAGNNSLKMACCDAIISVFSV